MRVIKILAPAFLVASALAGCVDSPFSSRGGGAVPLSLAPRFSFAVSPNSLPIEVVTTTPYFASDNSPAGEPNRNEDIRPNDPSWVVDAFVDLEGRDTATIVVEVELISTASGDDVVEWSGVIGPIFVDANATPAEFSQPVTLVRGPLYNAGVESLRVSGPSFIYAGTSVGASASVTAQGAHSVRWSSSNPVVASVDPVGDTVLVHGHSTGDAWIRAGAGFHADSFFVHVDATTPGEPAQVEALPDSAVVVVGATRTWFAFVTDSAGLPLATPVTWESLDEAVATVSATGVVSGVSVGRAPIVARAGTLSDTAIAIVRDLPAGVDLMWQGGTPGAETDWFTADNWSPARVPAASDVVYLPGGTPPVYLTSDTEVGGVIGDSIGGYSLELLENVRLTSHGDVNVPYIYGDTTTRLILDGAPSTLWGYALPPLVVRGDVTVLGSAFAYGDLLIENGAMLRVGPDDYVIVEGDLTVIGAGLTMTSDTVNGFYSYVNVRDDVLFDGGDGTGRLAGGYLDLGGDFIVTDASCTAFRPTDLPVEIISDTSTISLGCAGPAGNRFWDLWLYSSVEGDRVVTLQSDLYVANELYIAWDGQYPTYLVGNGHTVTMYIGSISTSTFDHAYVDVLGQVDGYFYADSLAFTGMTGATRPQLRVNDAGDGCFSCYDWQHVEFDPTSSGPYIELNDLAVDGDSAIYYMAANPGDGPQRTVTSGEAAVYWAGIPDAIQEWSVTVQTGPALQPLPDSFVVRVIDYYGEPVGGVTVNWTVTDSDGSVSPASVVTDTAGLAATQYTMGSVNYTTQEIIATTAMLADTAFFYGQLGAGPAPQRSTVSVTPRSSPRAVPIDPREREPRIDRLVPARPEPGSALNNGERR